MTVLEKMRALQQAVKTLRLNEELKSKNALPSGCYFLNEDEVVCTQREFGDARYPYSVDGLTLWAYSSGNVKIEESTFNILLNFCEGKEPNLAFFLGIKQEEDYIPISLTGVCKAIDEGEVERYSVFTPQAAYYFVETRGITACVRMFVDGEKNIRFTLTAENENNEKVEIYLASYFNCMLSHANYEYIETKWYRTSRVEEDGFSMEVCEHIDRNTCFTHHAYLARDSKGKRVYSTTSRTEFNGGMHNQLYASTSLRKGYFAEGKMQTNFTDTAIEGDILPLVLNAGENFAVSYTLAIANEAKKAKLSASVQATTEEIDKLLYDGENIVGKAIPKVEIEGFTDETLKNTSFNYFIKNVFRQAEFCARAKNYAGPFIGIRDIFQQLEAALLWIPEYCRKKIVEALNFIGENGRAPRQYSYPSNEKSIPAMDMRPYIDQGVWIISTVYTYLSYTADFSILEEKCGYYKFNGNTVDFSKEKDSVLAHLLRICDYLLSNIDEETHCLHALYGDWNDALDGLGRTEEKGKEYGNGVSVMATLKLCKNLDEICDILHRFGEEEKIAYYRQRKEEIRAGLLQYAVVKNEKGERKVVHGWGENRSHTVGSYQDVDGFDRYSLTSNAYWVLSGAIDWDNSFKADILKVYTHLDSKYGIKTFEPYFAKENTKVGRITRLPKGTAENGAVYIHATLFAIWSLFKMGEAERAWEQLVKILPITHEFISTTPFVMPNSYAYNEELGFDGESMNDWFTGSGCVLLKVLIWYIFGVQADLDGVSVKMPNYIPFEKASIELCVKGGKLFVTYEKLGKDRKYYVDGRETKEIYLDNQQLIEKTYRIKITD